MGAYDPKRRRPGPLAESGEADGGEAPVDALLRPPEPVTEGAEPPTDVASAEVHAEAEVPPPAPSATPPPVPAPPAPVARVAVVGGVVAATLALMWWWRRSRRG